jgi:sortase A
LNRAIEAERASPNPTPQSANPDDTVPAGEVLGQLEVPRVHLSVIVMEGDDDATLKNAVGHLPDTPLPWDNGNSAFAGHRDTFLRPLKDVRAGDEIRLTSVHGTFVYRVRETRVVDPGDIEVLAPTSQPELTLVTCYPFYYVGNAPRRFIVSAERVESLPVVVATASHRTP